MSSTKVDPRYGAMLTLDELEVCILGLERARDAGLMAPGREAEIDRALKELYEHHRYALSDHKDWGQR